MTRTYAEVCKQHEIISNKENVQSAHNNTSQGLWKQVWQARCRQGRKPVPSWTSELEFPTLQTAKYAVHAV